MGTKTSFLIAVVIVVALMIASRLLPAHTTKQPATTPPIPSLNETDAG
jgi:hypothetical protein